MFTQLNPAIPVHVIAKGDGFAIGVIDYGQEHNLIWVTALDANGELWCAPNPTVRLLKNWTMGREESREVTASKAAVAASAEPETLCAECSGNSAAVSANA